MKITEKHELFNDQGYIYKEAELTPTVLAVIMIHQLNGKRFKRSEAIEAAKEYHLRHGGLAMRDNYTDTFKRVANDQLSDYMNNIIRNLWYLNFTPEDLEDFIERPEDSKEKSEECVPTTNVAVEMADDIIGEGDECVYVYYYETYKEMAMMKGQKKWKCKIGMSTSSAADRVMSQTGTALPEKPHIGLIIKTTNAKCLESLLHHCMKYHGAYIAEAPGTEWFETSPEEILGIYNNINSIDKAPV